MSDHTPDEQDVDTLVEDAAKLLEEMKAAITVPWNEFLESMPSGQRRRVSNALKNDGVIIKGVDRYAISTTDIHIYCHSDKCNGMRYFQIKREVIVNPSDYHFLTYTCRNCRSYSKTYSLKLEYNRINPNEVTVTKLGEDPPLGFSTPARLISMIGPDRELYMRGRRCEIQGLGIGAYAYYRRVVERQKNRLISELEKAAKIHGASNDDLAKFQALKNEFQFTKSVEGLKGVIPDKLFIEGENPLVLLHSALSYGIHELSEEDCLENAKAIRLVLTKLAENIAELLSDKTELKHAVKRLTSVRTLDGESKAE